MIRKKKVKSRVQGDRSPSAGRSNADGAHGRPQVAKRKAATEEREEDHEALEDQDDEDQEEDEGDEEDEDEQPTDADDDEASDDDESDPDVAEDEDDESRRKGKHRDYYVCGRHAATGECRRLLRCSTVQQAREEAEPVRAALGWEFDEFWLERVQRIEI